MSKYLPEGWTQDRIDDALEFQRKSPNPTNPKQEGMNMKNQAKDSLENATERPWRYTRHDGQKEYGVHHDNIFIRSGEKVICEVWEENEANAALIVRCVNSHDALVEALQEVLSVIDAGRDFDCNEHNKAILVNALKIAKGE